MRVVYQAVQRGSRGSLSDPPSLSLTTGEACSLTDPRWGGHPGEQAASESSCLTAEAGKGGRREVGRQGCSRAASALLGWVEQGPCPGSPLLGTPLAPGHTCPLRCFLPDGTDDTGPAHAHAPLRARRAPRLDFEIPELRVQIAASRRCWCSPRRQG